MAERKVARVQKRLKEADERAERFKRNKAQMGAVAQWERQKSMARKARLQTWDMGPAAPNRDAFQTHGAIASRSLQQNMPLQPHELDERCRWAGGRHTLCLAPGDRVVVVQGRWKGQISHIKEIHMERAEVDLGEVGKIAIKIPVPLAEYSKTMTASTGNLSLPISWVRLVHPVPDPGTGMVRDTVIHQLVASGVVRDRPTRTSAWTRVVPRLNISIPWPKKREEVNPEPHPADTLRMEVERTSFVPTLLRPPMPPTVIDELRGYYSRFRTRHDSEWVTRKESIEQRNESYLTDAAGSMLTPLQEKNIIERLERRAQGQPKLSANMLQRIGQIIAKNQPGKLVDMEQRIAKLRIENRSS